jgi:hypothetical protein
LRQHPIVIMEIAMNICDANLLVHLAHPSVGNDIGALVRDLRSLHGVQNVFPVATLSRLLVVECDLRVIAARALLGRIRRRWSGARLLRAAGAMAMPHVDSGHFAQRAGRA